MFCHLIIEKIVDFSLRPYILYVVVYARQAGRARTAIVCFVGNREGRVLASNQC